MAFHDMVFVLTSDTRPSSSSSDEELSDRINLRAVYLSGEGVMEFRARATLRLRDIKSRLSDLCEVPDCCLRLVVGSQEIEEEGLSKTVAEAGLGEGSILQVVKLVPSPLSLYALSEDDPELARYMLRCAADPNEVGSDYRSTLLFAGERNLPDVCQVLVELDEFARINDAGDTGHTALHWAAYWKHENLCLLILGREDLTVLNAVDYCGRVVFHYACAFRMAALSWAILEREDFHTIAVVDGDGHSSLHGAVGAEMPDVAFAILTHPQFTTEAFNRVDYNSQTVLMLAIQGKLEHICHAILERADFAAVSAADKYGATALHYAAERNLPGVCRAILARADGELLEARDARGKTAHDLACEGGLQEVVAIVTTRGRRRDGMSHQISPFG